MDIKGYKELELQKIDFQYHPIFRDESLDNEHIQIIRIYNEGVENAQKGIFNLNDIAFGLISSDGDHFKKEEQLMQQVKYPAYRQHKDDHAIFVWKINNIIAEAIDFVESYLELLGFLHMWIMGHIFVVDKRFGEYLQTIQTR